MYLSVETGFHCAALPMYQIDSNHGAYHVPATCSCAVDVGTVATALYGRIASLESGQEEGAILQCDINIVITIISYIQYLFSFALLRSCIIMFEKFTRSFPWAMCSESRVCSAGWVRGPGCPYVRPQLMQFILIVDTGFEFCMDGCVFFTLQNECLLIFGVNNSSAPSGFSQVKQFRWSEHWKL